MTRRRNGRRIEIWLPENHRIFDLVQDGERSQWIRDAIDSRLNSDKSDISSLDSKLDRIIALLEDRGSYPPLSSPIPRSVSETSKNFQALYNF